MRKDHAINQFLYATIQQRELQRILSQVAAALDTFMRTALDRIEQARLAVRMAAVLQRVRILVNAVAKITHQVLLDAVKREFDVTVGYYRTFGQI